MILHLSKEVQKKLTDKKQAVDRLFLDFEDGEGPFAATAITCRLDVSFRFLLVAQGHSSDTAIYDERLTTEIGEIYFKHSAEKYLEPEVEAVFNSAYGTIQLKGKSGVLADNVPIISVDQKFAG